MKLKKFILQVNKMETTNLRDRCSVTWNLFKTGMMLGNSISLVQDPVCSSYIELQSFIELYQKVLEELDGSDLSSFVDFFFEPSHINQSILVFIDSDAQEDFRSMAEELEVIPKLKEVMEGETIREKTERMERERVCIEAKSQAKTQVKTQAKTPPSPLEKQQKKIEQMRKTLMELSSKIANSTDIEVIKRYQKKMLSVSEALKNITTV